MPPFGVPEIVTGWLTITVVGSVVRVTVSAAPTWNGAEVVGKSCERRGLSAHAKFPATGVYAEAGPDFFAVIVFFTGKTILVGPRGHVNLAHVGQQLSTVSLSMALVLEFCTWAFTL